MWKGGRWEEISHFNKVGSDSVEKEKKEGNKNERKGKKEEGKWSEKLHLISNIYGDRAIAFRRSKRQSSSMQRELRVGIRI